jgi:hypothetical protein
VEAIMRTHLRAIITAVLLIALHATFAPAEERSGSNELLITPHYKPSESSVSKELSTPRYAISTERVLSEKLAIIASYAFIDYNQSVAMFYGSEGYYELNPVLSRKPSKADMITLGLVGMGLVYIITKTLPDPWRQIAVDSVIASEQMNIEDNRRLYAGWNTDGPPIRGRLINGIPIVISLRF